MTKKKSGKIELSFYSCVTRIRIFSISRFSKFRLSIIFVRWQLFFIVCCSFPMAQRTAHAHTHTHTLSFHVHRCFFGSSVNIIMCWKWYKTTIIFECDKIINELNFFGFLFFFIPKRFRALESMMGEDYLKLGMNNALVPLFLLSNDFLGLLSGS